MGLLTTGADGGVGTITYFLGVNFLNTMTYL